MIMLRALTAIMLTAVLTNNYALRQFLGVCPLLGVTKEIKSAVGMSGAVIFVMLLATAATWPIQTYLLDPAGLGFLQTVVFILMIAALVQLVEITLKKYVPKLYSSLGVYLPLIATNCALLGVTISNINAGFTFVEAMVNSLGAGLGIFLAMALFAGLRDHIQNAKPPESFEGLPLALVSLAILSLAFYGFDGVIENIFG